METNDKLRRTALELKVFAGQEKSELSMIEVARAILESRGRDHEMYFSDLVNEIQNYLEKSDADIRQALPFFYSDLNTDGSFIPLGENRWGLRTWYAIDEIDEEVITLEENGENAPKRKRKRVNAFMDGDEDAIDYNDDDPEDEDNFTPTDVEYDDENPDDEKSEVESYDSEINEIIPDEEVSDDEDDVDLNESDDEDDDEAEND
ncbi:DNA-directed RNA polymerase, delta subunit [Streptococcus sobrinus W1703]|uniref:Probable DNA-directed RNA polymerase subunit delta n=1 Tax=Streptococcus sobrinus W1703 TaxID=1227275 RepID=U2KLZ0_9STRE|nr:DNA-directed RNA polymerase, delta subunit [Streptococcus sobrinus W1703]